MDKFLVTLIIVLTTTVTAANIIMNPSFEADHSWTFNVRKSMWKVETARENLIRYSNEKVHAGRRSLQFLSYAPNSAEAVYVNQFIYVSDLDMGIKQNTLPIEFSAWFAGEEAASLLRFIVDIRYEDGRYFQVETSPESKPISDTFIQHCILIPGYGVIKALMVHVVVQGVFKHGIWVDDISLEFTDRGFGKDGSCKLYTDSYPPSRQVIVNFLRPAITLPDGTGVTLATQLTMDRLAHLEETAGVWRGPISAALFFTEFPGDRKALSHVLQRYMSSKDLHSYVTIHIVFEDLLNTKDSTLYPVNFLRNVAIKNVATDYVFYADADTVPSFNASDGLAWLQKTKESFSECQDDKCAYIVPTFHAKRVGVTIPRNKSALLDELHKEQASLEPFLGVSHGVVKYGQWCKSDEPYRVDYREDMEPYFIVHRDAPLMSEMFAGYGRDKCAYSKDIHWAGYRFLVLTQPFLVNRPELPGSRTIYSRSNGLRFRVFLNIAFHNNELQWKYIKSRETQKIETKDIPTRVKISANDQDAEEKKSSRGFKGGEASITGTKAINPSVTGYGCGVKFFGDDSHGHNKPMIKRSDDWRKDIFIERLIQEYNVGVYIQIPTAVTGLVNTMLPFAHPDAVVSVIPDGGNEPKIDTTGVFTTIRGGNSTVLLRKARSLFSGPSLIWVDAGGRRTEETVSLLTSALLVTDDRDLVAVDGADSHLENIHTCMCSVRTTWHLNLRDHVFFMKSHTFTKPNTDTLPPLPDLSHVHHSAPFCDKNIVKTDIIVFTKNRPMQMFAFLESLHAKVTGVNTVWVIQYSNDVFENGYKFVYDHFSSRLHVRIIHQEPEQFGKTLSSVIENLEAKYVVLAVDEIIWLRELDLLYSSCLLESSRGEIASFQLRLGKNINVYRMIKETNERFKPLSDNPDVLLFYPKRLPYDFGYILNVDGTLVSKENLLKDIKQWVQHVAQPGALESRWIRSNLHTRCRQWHLMYTSSMLVNNALSDGRVVTQDTPNEESRRLQKLLIEDKKKIDIELFTQENHSPASCHLSKPIKFISILT